MAGSMAQVMSWSHVIGEMTEGVCDPSDRKAVTARLVQFVSAGFRAVESSRVSGTLQDAPVPMRGTHDAAHFGLRDALRHCARVRG